MRVVTVTEALALEIGEKIPSIKARVEKVYDQTTGENTHGPWSIQNINVVDPANPKSKTKLKVFNQEALPKNIEGKVIYIESQQGDKGLLGIEVAKDTYKWKDGDPIKKLIEVRKQATITVGEPQAQGQQAAPQNPAPANTPAPAQNAPANQQASAPANTPAPQKPAKTAADVAAERFTESKKHVGDFRRQLGRHINALRMIRKAVFHLDETEKKEGRALTPEQIQGLTTTLYIQLQRSGLPDCLPYDDLEQYLPEKKSSTDAPQS